MNSVKLFCRTIVRVPRNFNPVFHEHTKHIDIRYHFLNDLIDEKLLHVEYLSTDEMCTDVLTKSLSSVPTAL